jgi:DNA polymerase-3 subunit alpha
MLFEESKISFNDGNLFSQNIKEWNSGFLLKNELEVIGFYFSNHPVSLYPKHYFEKNNIIDWDEIESNHEIKNAQVVGSILDIKERSNKDGKKYAFLTISTLESQIELSIFSDKLGEFRHLIKEGNVLLFSLDITRANDNLRLIIRKIVDFDQSFNKNKKTINIYLQSSPDQEFLNSLIKKSDNCSDNLYLYINKDGKLLSFDFSNIYEISSFKYLDQLMEAKKIDYSIDFL